MSDIGPGDWVECVNAEPLFPKDPRRLVKGALYQVTWVGVSRRGAMVGQPIVRLAGVQLFAERRGFWLQRFVSIRDGQQRIDRKALRKTHELV